MADMFAIIGGKRYSTATATLIGSAASTLDNKAPEYWSAGLYKTSPGGAFFLAGSGGFRSQFAATTDDAKVISGSKIIPLSSGDAQAWAEAHLDPVTIAANFTVTDA